MEIKHKEVNIDGTNVLAKLKSLQTQIDTLKTSMSSDYVKTGDQYYMKGHKDNWTSELGYSGNDARWHKDNTRMKFKIYKSGASPILLPTLPTPVEEKK